jgi:DNA-binding LacI/PurR family transcriptional regulator
MDMREERSGPMRRTTIYDIARLAETSASAVSSVLNGSWQKRRISKRLADRVLAIAEREGYSANVQASLLRRSSSNVIGMIVPKYDNRYFAAIAERFEAMARARGLFPVVTCTQREPELEVEAAKEIISFRAQTLIATGASDPARITALCSAAGVRTINLDLPGEAAPSVISDNYEGARALAEVILDRCKGDLGFAGPLHFVGGRRNDHNTSERLNGFLDAHRARGLSVPQDHILIPGYSGIKTEQALKSIPPLEAIGRFVNSTIALDGVVRWLQERAARSATRFRYGCFDFDPFAAMLPGNVAMIQQDTTAMLERVFELHDLDEMPPGTTQIPCLLRLAEPGTAVRS